jgi:hypothetical protein
MDKFSFKRHRIDKLSREEMLSELEKAAEKFNYIEFGWRDFNKVANISANPVKKEFGGWRKALAELKELLQSKGKDLSLRKVPPNRIHSDKDMFDEMEKIWKELGHRPSRTEWELAKPKIHYNTYKQRFGGWQNACLKFIEYKMGGEIEIDEGKEEVEFEKPEKIKKVEYKTGDTRTIPVSVHLKVLSRDNYRCVFCGRSPATDIGVRLYLDHIKPFSKGGKSTEENLQTLC